MADMVFTSRQKGPELYAAGPLSGRFRVQKIIKFSCFSLFLLLMLSGCAMRLLYPRLPFLVNWRFDHYVKLTDDQDKWLDTRLHQLLDWHRLNELPRYVEFLQRLRSDVVAHQLTTDKLLAYRQEGKAFVTALERHVLPDLVEFIPQLSDGQSQRLMTHLRKDLADYQDDVADKDSAERADDRYNEWRDFLEDYTGRLSSEQRHHLRQFTDASVDMIPHVMAGRERWLQFIEASLAHRTEPDTVDTALDTLMFHPELLRSDTHQQLLQQMREQQTQFYLELLASLSPKQQRHLLSRLDDWIDDFSKLQLK